MRSASRHFGSPPSLDGRVSAATPDLSRCDRISLDVKGLSSVVTPSNTRKALAIVAILGSGLIHLYLARVASSAVPYLGILFVANGIGAIVAAVGIALNRVGWGWTLGLAVAGLTLLGYVLSRTVGLPGLPAIPSAWFDPLGVASLVCEALFIILFALGRQSEPEAGGFSLKRRPSN